MPITDAQAVADPHGVVVDTITGKLYLDRSGQRQHLGRHLDGSDPKKLYNGTENKPTDLAIDPVGGKLYWGTANGMRVGTLDDSPAADLFPNETDVGGVAIDVPAGKIYWGLAHGRFGKDNPWARSMEWLGPRGRTACLGTTNTCPAIGYRTAGQAVPRPASCRRDGVPPG